MEIIIRQMEATEAKEIKRISKLAFTGLEPLLANTPKQALIAEVDGKIVGGITYKYIDCAGQKVGYFNHAFIDPDYHGKGIGTKLYRATTEFLWEQGCDALSAEVKDDNVASWGLLVKNGFTRVSVCDVIKQMGFLGMLKLWFCTMWVFAVGMDCYFVMRNPKTGYSRRGNLTELATFALTNITFALLAIPFGLQNPTAFIGAFMVLLLGGAVAGYIGTLLSQRDWAFRVTNGGVGISAMNILFGGIFPLLGTWYPSTYQNTKEFRRDLGIVALSGWIFTLILAFVPSLIATESVFVSYLLQLGDAFLTLRIIAIYPFSAFGGMRVYQWNKWVFAVVAVLSLIVIVLT